jgi:hypothetical protein
MNPAIREQIRFVLEDDNELMRAALDPDSDLDEDNKQMNRKLIKEHERILAKLDSGRRLTKIDLQLIRDANEIHRNDEANLNGRHRQAVALDRWLQARLKKARGQPSFDEDGRCRKCGSRVSFADVTDTLVFVGNEIMKRYDGDITNRNCVKCHYPEQYPDFEDYDKGVI